MTYEQIIQQIINNKNNPNDFKITIFKNGYKVEPRLSYEQRKIAQFEDKPIINDVNDVAEFATITAMDKDEIAEMLVYALQKIDELEVRFNG